MKSILLIVVLLLQVGCYNVNTLYDNPGRQDKYIFIYGSQPDSN